MSDLLRPGPRTAAAFVTLALASSPLAAGALPATISFISVSPSPSDPEAPVTVTVAVAAADAGADGGDSGVPTGSITVATLSNSDWCTADLDGGVGTCVLSIASTGEVGISAQYSGDNSYDPSSNSTSHAVTVPAFTIAGPSATAYDAGLAVTFTGLQASGAVEVFVDSVSQQLITYASDAVPSSVTLYLGPNYAPGCHSISAVNDDASAPPLGIFLDPTGIADATPPCKAAMVSRGVAAASLTLGQLQPNVSGAIEVALHEAADAGASRETLLVAQLPSPVVSSLGTVTPSPIVGFDLHANLSAGSDAVVQLKFFVSSSAGDAGAEASAGTASGPHALLYFDNATRTLRPIQPPLTEVTTDGGSAVIVTFNAASFPSVNQLGGTMFVLVVESALGADGGADSGPSEAAADAQIDASAGDATVDGATVDGDSVDGATVEAMVVDAAVDATMGGSSDGGSGLDASTTDAAMPVADASLPSDSGESGSGDASAIGARPPAEDSSPLDSGAASGEGNASGCGCRTAQRTSRSLPLLSLAALALLVARRRRKRTC
jgi:MYXO-CTERM domain-containing protein